MSKEQVLIKSNKCYLNRWKLENRSAPLSSSAAPPYEKNKKNGFF